MDSLLVDCLPFLSDHLEVKDLFRLESVSKRLQKAVIQDYGDELFQKSIRARVGYAKDFPATGVPVQKRQLHHQYCPELYPFRLCFHAKLEHYDDGLTVENLSVEMIRDMGKAVARFQEELTKGAPLEDAASGKKWNNHKWYSPGYMGPRGGFVRLEFELVCGIVLVFSKHAFVRGFGYHSSHGFWDESNQCFQYAVKREKVPMRDSDGNLNYYTKTCQCVTSVPERMYDDITEETYDPRVRCGLDKPGEGNSSDNNKYPRFMDVWSRVDRTTTATANTDTKEKYTLELLKDTSGTIFAITSRRQLLRRLVKHPHNRDVRICQKLTTLEQQQCEIANQFLAPFIGPGHESLYNATIVLGFDPRLCE